MADTDNMIHITQRKLEQLVGQNAGSIRKTKQGVVRKHRSQTHGPRMQDSFMTEVAKTRVAMNNLDLFANNDVPKDWEEREDSWHSALSIYHQKRHMIDFEPICQVPDPSSSLVRVCYNHHLVASIDQLRGELINVTFDASRLRKEEVADHSDVVGHFED